MYQRDLSVAYDEVGNVLVAQGDLTAALQTYRDSLAIFERLANADPGNAGWQRDLSVAYDRVGNVLVEQGCQGALGNEVAATAPLNCCTARRQVRELSFRREHPFERGQQIAP